MNLRPLFTFVTLAMAFTAWTAESKVGEPLPKWQEGYLDIHAVNAASGECSFMIFPDGTTMLIDAGEVFKTDKNIVAPKPDAKAVAHETYARYIKHFLDGTHNNALDYTLLTHFHEDHMGTASKSNCKPLHDGAYLATGIPAVAEYVPMKKVIDRAWPTYDVVVKPVSKSFPNYKKFLDWQIKNNGMQVERFQPGRNDQITLQHNARKYPTFEVRNLAANGVVWTGIDTVTRNYFIPSQLLEPKQIPDENCCSIALRVSYGKFDYFTGGDLESSDTAEEWHVLDRPVANACGPVEAAKACHHMNYNSMGDDQMIGMRPRVIIGHTRKAQQPDLRRIRRVLGSKIYPGKKDVFTTNYHPATELYVFPQTDMLAARQGHIVIRVQPGGDSYYVYVLDDTNYDYRVKSIHGPYTCE